MKKDGYIEGFLNSELPIKASLSVSTEYRSYRPFFLSSENLGHSVLMARFSLYFFDILCTKTTGNFLMPCFWSGVLDEILRQTYAL